MYGADLPGQKIERRAQQRRRARRLRRLLLESLEPRQVLAAALYALPIGQGNFIVELNPTTGAEVRRFASPAPVTGGPDGLAFNGESLFFLAGTNQLYEVNPTTGNVIDSDSLSGIGSGSFDGLGVLGGKLYIQDYNLGRIHVYDPVGDVLLNSLTIAGGVAGGLTGASGPDELIATVGTSSAARINPATGAVTGTINLGGGQFYGVAAVGNQLYFGGPAGNQIRVTDRTGTFVSNITTPYGVSALASDDTRIERLSNGGFELGTSGWTELHFGPAPGGFQTYTGANPFGSNLPAPPIGNSAVANNHTGPGTYLLYRDIVLPAGQSHTLSLSAYYENRHTAFVTPATLDYQTGQNQQFRIDIIKTTSDPLSVSASDVLQSVFKTSVGDPLTRSPTSITSDLTSLAGQTVRLRIAVVNNMNFLFGAVDGVSLISSTTPVAPPATTRIYVAEQPLAGGPGGRVEVFDENLAFVSTIDDPIFDTGIINDIELGPTGDVFVALDLGTLVPGKIARFTSAGTFVNFIALPNDLSGQPLSLFGFDVADDGSFWTAHPGKANKVFHVSSTGTLLGETPVASAQPYDVSVTTLGQVFASNGQAGEAFGSLRADGNRWQARFGFGDAQLLSPSGTVLATRTVGGQVIDAQESDAGNLYLTQIVPTPSVRRFDSSGTATGLANTLERAVGVAVVTTATTPPPATTRIYVAESDPLDNVGGRVEVYDESLLLQFTIDDSVFDTGSINDVELGPTGDVFVSMDNIPGGQGRIVQFTATGTFVSSITLPVEFVAGPPIRVVGFDVADDGTFWVVHPNRSNVVFHISAAGSLLGQSAVTATQPIDVAINSSGQLFVSTLANGETLSSLRADGNRWQARQGPGDVVLLSPTNTVLATRTPGSPVIDVQEADSGNLFVTRNLTANSLLKYTSAGAAAGSISTPERAVGIAVSTAVIPPPAPTTTTRIYVSEREPDGIGGRIEVFDPSLALVLTIDHPVFDNGTLSDIEIGPNGNIYVGLDTTAGGNPSGAGGQIVEFTPTGTFVGTINLPTDSNGSSFFPLGFDIAPDGSFRVAAPNTPNLVFHVSPTGAMIASLFVSTNSAADVSIEADNSLYATSVPGGEASVNIRADGNRWVARHLAGIVELRAAVGGAVLATRSFGPSPVDAEEAANGDLYAMRFGTSAALRKYDSAGNIINTVNLTEVGAGIAVASTPTTFQVTNFAATPTGAVLDFSANVDASKLNLYDTQAATNGPADLVLQTSGGASVRGSLVVDPGLRRVTFVATAGRLPPDTYTLTLRSSADGFVNASQDLLDGDASGAAGGNYVRTFTVTASPPGAVAISLPNFARGPQQPVNLPANVSTGIPISFSEGVNITSANFILTYNPALLTITGGAVASGLPAGATVNVNVAAPGTAVVQFISPTPLPLGTTRFVDLQANVPSSASYRSKHVLNISTISINGGNIPGIDDDAIHLVAFFGDANGSNTYTSADAAVTSRVAIGLDQGLAAYRLVDPVIVLDLNESGSITSADSSRALQLAVGTVVPTVPFPLPGGAVTPGGPDPKISIPKTLTAEAGGDVAIPVQVDSVIDLTGAGISSADLVMFYDPAVLTINSVELGSLVANAGGWVVTSRIDPLAGRVSISLVGKNPLEGVFVGDLVVLQATIAADAPAVTTSINLAESAKSPAQYTSLNDGHLTLIPAPTDAGNDPVDGLLSIAARALDSAPPVRIMNDRLLVVGTAGDDRILVARISDELVRVRVNDRIVGDYPLGAGVVVDALAGQDHVVMSGLPPALVATSADDRSAVVFGGETATVVHGVPVALGLRDEALLQLLATWTDQLDSASSEASANRQPASARWIRRL